LVWHIALAVLDNNQVFVHLQQGAITTLELVQLFYLFCM